MPILLLGFSWLVQRFSPVARVLLRLSDPLLLLYWNLVILQWSISWIFSNFSLIFSSIYFVLPLRCRISFHLLFLFVFINIWLNFCIDVLLLVLKVSVLMICQYTLVFPQHHLPTHSFHLSLVQSFFSFISNLFHHYLLLLFNIHLHNLYSSCVVDVIYVRGTLLNNYLVFTDELQRWF